MSAYTFAPAPQITAAIFGNEARFPVRRIYCVGRNYADHILEMGLDPAREPPFFFAKPADALVDGNDAMSYPPETMDLQHEVELVIAIHQGGRDIAPERALQHVFGYAVGVDMTRRDTQVAARRAGRPWEHGKSFDESAPMGPIHRIGEIGHPVSGTIWLDVDGVRRQSGDLNQMIWPVPEIISALSRGWALQPGDLIFTGTPAGIGTVLPGNMIRAGIEHIGDIEFKIEEKNHD